MLKHIYHGIDHNFYDLEFSDSDIQSAQYFELRCNLERMYIDVGTDTRHYCHHFGGFFLPYRRHSYRTGPYYSTKKAVSWRKNRFFLTGAGIRTIFCSERACRLLNSICKGIEYADVVNETTHKPVRDLYEIKFSVSIPFDFVVGGKTYKCKRCGKDIFILPDRCQIRIKKEGFCSGYNCFGLGNERYVVTREIMDFLKEKGMNRNLKFTPIIVV